MNMALSAFLNSSTAQSNLNTLAANLAGVSHSLLNAPFTVKLPSVTLPPVQASTRGEITPLIRHLSIADGVQGPNASC